MPPCFQVVDSLLGFTAHKCTGAFTVTASLTVNYRKPVPLGSTVIAEAWLDRREGRKAPAVEGGRAEHQKWPVCPYAQVERVCAWARCVVFSTHFSSRLQ